MTRLYVATRRAAPAGRMAAHGPRQGAGSHRAAVLHLNRNRHPRRRRRARQARPAGDRSRRAGFRHRRGWCPAEGRLVQPRVARRRHRRRRRVEVSAEDRRRHAADAKDAPRTAEETLDDATTALVFDHLSSETLRLAQRATLDYVPMNGESKVRVGVFATDPGIRVVQPYTTDRSAVRKARRAGAAIGNDRRRSRRPSATTSCCSAGGSSGARADSGGSRACCRRARGAGIMARAARDRRA